MVHRPRCLSLAAATMVATVIWLPAAGAPVEAASPPYVVDGGRMIEIASNDSWTVDGVPAREYQRSTTEYSNDPYYSVWSGRCRARAQTLRFKRTVTLLGAPRSMKAHVGVAGGGYAPLYSVTMLFNDKVAWRSAVENTEVLPLRAANLLHSGRNTITVVVKKKADRIECTGFRGVFFTIEGSMQADLAVATMREPRPTLSRKINLIVNMKNRGPALMPHARFVLRIPTGLSDGERIPEFTIEEPAYYPGGFISDCVTDSQLTAYEIECTLDRMTVEVVGWVGVRITFTPDTVPFGYRGMSASWRIDPVSQTTGPQDFTLTNNTGGVDIIFCESPSTSPPCSELPPG